MEPRFVLASLAMAAGIFAHPFIAGATTITPKDANDAGKITQTGNVYNINPQKVVSEDFAYNRFSAFSLDAGHIANLNFGNAAALANRVQNKIDINGIVNGIRGGKIDGHLIFLSPNGIAVGASGVINAGQFTGIVPTQTAFNTLYNADNITLDAVTALKTGSYANDKNIEIKGQINTHSGVMLGAGIINIKDGAKIQSTKNLDFKDLVNISGDNPVNAGLTLTAATGTGGDIILTAKQESAVADTKPVLGNDGNPVTENGKPKTEAHAIRWSERSTDLSAAVNIGKDVKITNKDGAVTLTATSTSTYEDSTPMTLTGTLKDVILGEDKTFLDGAINKLAGKEAAANKYLFVNYSGKKNKASVNIGENSTISGTNIDIAATSKVELNQSIAVPTGEGKKDSNDKTVAASDPAAMAAVAVSRVYNNAEIVVDGNLTATGAAEDGSGIKLAANADTKAALSATAGGGASTKTAVGVAVLTGDTNAKVTVNAPELKAEKGKVSVEATTNSDVDVTANAVGNTSYVVSNVGVANYDTSADVTINRAITAGAVDIKAENTVAGLKMTVDNTVQTPPSDGEGKDTAPTTEEQKQQDEQDANKEKTKPDTEKSEDEKESGKKSIDPTKVTKDASVDSTNDEKTKDAKEGVDKVKDKVENSAFGMGTAVGVFSNKNDANVTLGKNAAITAAPVENSETANGAVNVSAKTILQAAAEKEDSLRLSVKNTQANANVEIGAAVLVSNVKNNASVLLDSDGDKSAQITGTGAVSLDAAAGMGKYEVTQKKKNEQGQETNETEKVEKTSTLSYTVSAEGTAADDNPSKFALSGSVGVNTLKNNAVVLLGQKSKVEGSAATLSSDATTSAEGTYGATNTNSSVALGATVGLQNISAGSLVMAGKGAKITGTESVEVSANEAMDLKNSVQNAGKGDSFGVSGMVALSYGDSNSIVSIDDEANINAPGTLTITSTNSTNIDNSARSESAGQEGAKAFGIGAGIINYDVNSLAMVSDNGSGIAAPSAGTTDEQKAAKKIYEDAALARKIAGDTLAGKLGGKTADGAKGSIATGGLIGAAITTGMVQNDAKAKAVSAAPQADEDENSRKDSEKWTQWSGKGKKGAEDAKTDTKNLEEDKVTSQNESKAPSASGAAKEASQAANPDETPSDPTDVVPTNAGASIGIEGSAALTFLGGRTDAILDNVTVQNGENPVAMVSLSATDFLGSITLGGTNAKHSLKDGSAAKVGIGGTFAMNSANRDVDSLMRKSDLPMALLVSNAATKIGIEVAAGMGSSTAEGDGANINGAGVVYYNKAKQDIHALMIGNNVTGASVSNQATGTDFQVAGGLAATSGDVGVGGAVAISHLENSLASGIIGGEYTVFSSVDVEAQKGTTQINGALAGTKGGYGFEGAFAYGSTKNTTNAYISGATVTGIPGSAVNVKAGEIPVIKPDAQINEEKTKIDSKIDHMDDKVEDNDKKIDSTTKNTIKKQTKDALDNETKTQKQNEKTLKDKGIDTTGTSYLDTSGEEKSALEEETKKDAKGNDVETDGGKIADEAAGDESDAKDELGKNRSITITAAMGGGWNGSVGAGAGIAYNYVKNDIAADIKGSTITADTVSGEAASDSLIVSVGAGTAVGGKAFNGAGSGSWNDLKNDTKVTFANNTITGKTISEQAQNAASIINIAGEVAGGRGMSMGLSLAYNSLNNTAGTYMTGNTVNLQGEENAVTLATENKGKTLAVAGSVNVSIGQSYVGAVGTVAINRGASNTESVIDGRADGENKKLDNVKELSVTASELTKTTTVAGGVSVGGKKVGVGGAVAYASVGTSGNREKLRAEVSHADITTTENGKIEVSATDSKTDAQDATKVEKSRVTTVGAGFGVEWGKNFFNLQGAAAVSDIYKDNIAALDNTNINANNADHHPTVSVAADTKSKINTVGAVGNVAVGTAVTGAAGVAINRMEQDTRAEMATGSGTTTVNAGLAEVRATGDADIHSVGVGGIVGVNERVSFGGSGSYNYIGNNVNAIVQNQILKSNSSVGVVAQSDDRLYNFAGGFAIGANTNAALGAAVSINKITGDTNALVQGGSVAAADVGPITVSRPQDDNLFTTASLDLTTDRTKLSENRKPETKTGVVVDSSATHTLISQLSSGGVAASSSVGVSLDGTVNLTTVEG
ncbi:MAG: leukotoxin LktA family filamentous adhesin, partial [Schwartzia sp.]|nr:leukotoxin LktA family filamentous adhesin [Schwartzia sp. (in: firmicutes)]